MILHRAVVAESGGADGIRDLGALESSLAQPRATFGGINLYPSLIDKAATVGYGLAMNHPFIDGNKRIAHAAVAVFLELNGSRIDAAVDDQERLMLDLAAGLIERAALVAWLSGRVVPL